MPGAGEDEWSRTVSATHPAVRAVWSLAEN